MSLAELVADTSPARQAIVDALAQVGGLSPSPSTPAPIVAGSAWPARYERTWLNACASQDGWYVFVALPNGDLEATIDVADPLIDDVAAVLWPIGQLVRVEPWRFPVEPGQQSVPVLRFQLMT